MKYLLKIDPFALMGSRQPGWPHQGGPMIKLSDVKVLTTINASLWPFRAALRPKNWPRSARHYGLRRHLVSTRAHYLHSGVNLDGTQHRSTGRCCCSVKMSAPNYSVKVSSHELTGETHDEPERSASGRPAEGLDGKTGDGE